MTRQCALVVSLLGAVASLSAQQPGTQTFQASARLVPISVVVHDRSGKPVEGLTAADFTISEDGVNRPVALFSVESRSRARADAAPAPPGVYTNQFDPTALGGVTLIVIDRVNTSAVDQRRAHEHLIRFLKQLDPADRVGLYLLDPTVLHVLHDVSRDVESLLRALDRAPGATSTALAVADERNLSADPTGAVTAGSPLDQFLAQSDAQLKNMQAFFEHVRVMDTTAALEALAGHLAGIRGRKNVIWVSGGFPLIIYERDGLRNMSPEVQAATRALTDSDIAIYPVDARGVLDPFVSRAADKVQVVRTLEESRRLLDASMMIADQTGGQVFHSTNDLGTAFARAVADSDLTYMLGYVPSAERWDGRFRRIRVSVNRPGVTVRHRSGYFAHSRQAETAEVTRTRIDEALSSPLDATAVALSIVPSPGATPTSRRLEIHLHAGAILLTAVGDSWEGKVHLAIAQGLTSGRLVRTLERAVELRLSPDQRAQLVEQGLTLTVTIEVETAAHMIRLVAWDEGSGRVGSITIPARD